MKMTKNQIKAVQALGLAQEHISKAIQEIRKAVELESCIEGYATHYTIPWLKNFRNNNTNQPGNIDELVGFIEKEAGMDL